MSFLALSYWGVVSLCFVFGQVTSAANSVQFNIKQDYSCIPSVPTIPVERNASLTVNVTGAILNEANCSTSNDPFLKMADLEQKESRAYFVKIPKVTEIHRGQWKCIFLLNKDNVDNVPQKLRTQWRDHNYTSVECNVQVNVTAPIDVISDITTNNLYIIIGSAVGALVVVTIIVQTIIIVHYKSKISRPNELSHLERPPTRSEDTTRYSSMPLKKSLRRKRESSGIYQSLENLSTVQKTQAPPNIKDRPPMPLPIFTESDDDNMIYCDGNTLTRMFTPEPPPIDTLPRNKKGKQNKPKPTVKHKPVQMNIDDMDDYDYADSDAHKGSMNRFLLKKSLPMQPRPEPKPIRGENPQKVNPKLIPPCAGAPVINELDNILKQRKLNLRVAETPSPEAAGDFASHHQLPRRGPAQRETPSPQHVKMGLKGTPEREMRSTPNAWNPVKPQIDPRPTQSIWPHDRSKGPRYQEDRSSESSRRPEIRAQNLPDRFEDQRIKEPPGVRSPFFKRTDLARALQPVQTTGIEMKSPPLPRKPGQVSDGMPPMPPAKRPLPPPPDAESVYEPVAEGESSDDEEWKMEPLAPYNIYNI